jgi:four helix bundle protein
MEKMNKRIPAKTFEDLEIWQRAHVIVLKVYEMTCLLPKEETYGLISQMRRCAVSIAANIAEGFRRRTSADKANFLLTSLASSDELDYYMILVRDLKFIQDVSAIRAEIKEVAWMIDSYRRAVKSSNIKNG